MIFVVQTNHPVLLHRVKVTNEQILGLMSNIGSTEGQETVLGRRVIYRLNNLGPVMDAIMKEVKGIKPVQSAQNRATPRLFAARSNSSEPNIPRNGVPTNGNNGADIIGQNNNPNNDSKNPIIPSSPRLPPRSPNSIRPPTYKEDNQQKNVICECIIY